VLLPPSLPVSFLPNPDMLRARQVLLFILVPLWGACGTREPVQPATDGTVPPDSAALSFRNVVEGSEFVGDAACFDCHEDLWRGYQDHGMARSYYRLTPQNAVEDFQAPPLHHEASGFYYRVFADDGAYFQQEYRLDAEGEATHGLVRRMDYVVGSGTVARTYLSESRGRLYELPLTWYTQVQRWDFSPGYERQNGRFDRLIPDRCMACHNSYPEAVPFVEGKYARVPEGIGCERCHGPGGLHVSERLAGPEVSGPVDATIVNPSHLALDRQLDVCQQCHLNGAVTVFRAGRDAYDFRPSESLADHVAFFTDEAGRTGGEVTVISHADRMQRSACFLGTTGRPEAMTCVTCHNPHEGFRDRGSAYFNATCVGCHAVGSLSGRLGEAGVGSVHGASADCVACHMPRVEVEEAPHTSFTDHWIRVVETAPDLPAPVASHAPAVLVPYFEKDEGGEGIYEGMAYIILGRQRADSLAYEKGIAMLEQALASDPDHDQAHYMLGWAHLQQGRIEKAIPSLEHALQQDADVPERLNALAQAYEAGGRDPLKISRLYRRALAIQPALADVRVNYGRFLEVQGQLPEAMEQYTLAVEEQPWLPVAHFNLGTGYLQQGAFDEAEAALRQAVTLQPKYPEALGNLGLLYATQGQPDKARVQFEQAVAVAPDHPTALGNLGTYHLNRDHLEEAIDLLTRAVEADPRYLDGLINLALAHFRHNDFEQARRYAQRALERDPANAMARQILGAL